MMLVPLSYMPPLHLYLRLYFQIYFYSILHQEAMKDESLSFLFTSH